LNFQLPGFISEEALLHGVETRTSSPVRIPRSNETYESTSLKGLYPVGEGAGYAGGIVSAAVDGMFSGFAVAKSFDLFDGTIEFKFRETLELTMGNPEPNPGLREQTGVYKARKKG
jgi:hypothetical protein